MDALTRTVPVTSSALAGLAFAHGPPALHAAALIVFLVPSRERRRRPVAAVSAFAFAALTPAAFAAYDYTASLPSVAAAVFVPLGLNVVLLGGALALRGLLAPLAAVSALVLLTAPPLATWNPLAIWPLAGLLFPGTGTLGLVLLAALIAALVVLRHGARRALVATAAALSLSLVAGAANAIERTGGDAERARIVVGLDTERGMPRPVDAALWRTAWRFEERDRIGRLDADTVLLPESALGEWRPGDAPFLDVPGTRVIAGARRYLDEDTYVNVLLDGATGEVLYTQRVPLPPFVATPGAHRAVPAPIPVASIDALLCVELANAWLSFRTFVRARGPVLYAANLGWSRHASLERRLRANGVHWARLFDVPLVAAINRAAPFAARAVGGGS